MISRNEIIGQKDLLDRIDYLIENDKLPRFIILVGAKNSGKKLIANYISDKLGATFVPCTLKADDVREVIDESYKQSELMCYMWADSDNMSITSKNAILKVTEEPPNSAYFIITLNDINNMLPTILSRGTQLFINPYSDKELIEYAEFKKYDTNKHGVIITNVCSNPGDIDSLFDYDIDKFVSFTYSILDNIGNASYANVLKLANSFKIKKDDDKSKYDILLFMRCFNAICLNELKSSSDIRYGQASIVCSECASEFRVSSISKLAVLDKWLLSIKEIFSQAVS